MTTSCAFLWYGGPLRARSHKDRRSTKKGGICASRMPLCFFSMMARGGRGKASQRLNPGPTYSSRYLTTIPLDFAYSISARVLSPRYPPTLMTKISSAMSILRLCISSSIAFVPSVHTSSSPLWPNKPTEITILPSRVSLFWTSRYCSLNFVLPQRVITLYLPTMISY